jgi:redox-sensitive bicupin YhaK (pirin superfamily)
MHQDSMGNKGVIKPGELQVMSAVVYFPHEFNDSKVDPLTLFQIWIIPNKKNVTPRYDQITISDLLKRMNFIKFFPNADEQGVWIHQDAWFSLADLSSGKELEYKLHKEDPVFCSTDRRKPEVADAYYREDMPCLTETTSVK